MEAGNEEKNNHCREESGCCIILNLYTSTIVAKTNNDTMIEITRITPIALLMNHD